MENSSSAAQHLRPGNLSPENGHTHIIRICAGATCHAQMARQVFDALRQCLDIADGLFTLEATDCMGACGLAPVMTVDGEVYAKMTPARAIALLEEIRAKGSAQA